MAAVGHPTPVPSREAAVTPDVGGVTTVCLTTLCVQSTGASSGIPVRWDREEIVRRHEGSNASFPNSSFCFIFRIRAVNSKCSSNGNNRFAQLPYSSKAHRKLVTGT